MTLLLDFKSIVDAAEAVTGIIAAGIVPAALEIMDQKVIQAVEKFVSAGYPLDAGAVLIVELDGLPAGVAREVEIVERVGADNGVGTVRVAADNAERELIWKGRKNAFGAIAHIKPGYYLHDTVVPRTRLAEVIEQVNAAAERHDLIVMNVFHAGDGNLHPLLVFDPREPGTLERVHAAGEEIVRIAIEAGGVLSGEHGIGLEKRRFMSLLFSPDDLAAQRALRDAFDPLGRANPLKVFPTGASCGDVVGLTEIPEGVWV
jgi:glycolate oxidase